PGVSLVAVVDTDGTRAAEVAGRHGAEAFTEIESALARDDVDAVSIVTPEAFHREPAVKAARAGKHVLLEKPIATTVEDGKAIVAAARAAGVRLTVGFESRFALGYAQVEEAIDGGTLGEVSYVYAKRRGDRSFADLKAGRVMPIFEIAIHDIDLFLWYTGFPKIVEVSCKSVEKVVHQQWGQPDWQIVTLTTETGALAVIDCGWALPYRWAGWHTPNTWHPYADVRMEVMGTAGAVYADLHPMLVRACDEGEGWKFPDLVYWPVVGGVTGGAIRAELEAFARAVTSDDEPLVTGEQALQSLEVALMAQRAYETGRPVVTQND
ncbi:MAG: Gfo/Idh/MocA family protein, partial [Chloroflexota bacterium]